MLNTNRFAGRVARPSVELRAWQVALLVAGWILLADNRQFFGILSGSLDWSSAPGMGVAATLVSLQAALLILLLLTLGAGRLITVVAPVLLILASVCGYFVDHAGVVFNTAMVNNIAATVFEGNMAEAVELSSAELWRHVALYGLLPSVLLMFVRVSRYPGGWEPASRAIAVGAVLLIGLAAGLPVYTKLALFAAEHREIRYYATPLYPIASLTEYVADLSDEQRPFRVIGADATRVPDSRRRRLGIMVVGETARADRFSLGGYGRETNPLLSGIGELQYFEADACGTSTAFAVPCMFFLRDEASYSPAVAHSESNVLDVLSQVGVATVWIDNNSSCKHVCDRIETVDLRRRPGHPILDEGDFDEVAIPAVKRLIERNEDDLLIVLHVMGSHGPAYSRRYPEAFAVFKPVCRDASPMNCSAAELSNAYDNSIVYTDYVLNELITLLKQYTADRDAFLLYVSDHGESLGEGGVFLHGLPARLAPPEQTHVPIVFWESWQALGGPARVSHTRGQPDELTHALVPNTLLGVFDVRTRFYREELDLDWRAEHLGGD